LLLNRRCQAELARAHARLAEAAAAVDAVATPGGLAPPAPAQQVRVGLVRGVWAVQRIRGWVSVGGGCAPCRTAEGALAASWVSVAWRTFTGCGLSFYSLPFAESLGPSLGTIALSDVMLPSHSLVLSSLLLQAPSPPPPPPPSSACAPRFFLLPRSCLAPALPLPLGDTPQNTPAGRPGPCAGPKGARSRRCTQRSRRRTGRNPQGTLTLPPSDLRPPPACAPACIAAWPRTGVGAPKTLKPLKP
jgi:hypothetical protein